MSKGKSSARTSIFRVCHGLLDSIDISLCRKSRLVVVHFRSDHLHSARKDEEVEEKEDKMTSEVSGVFRKTKKEEAPGFRGGGKYAPLGSRRFSITQQQVLGCPAPGLAYPARAAHLNIQKARNRKVSKCVCVLPFACPSQARREKE